MQTRCPSCRQMVLVSEGHSLGEISCGSCGHCFSLIGDETIAPSRQPEREIEHFRLERQLGAGAFGTVWLARDQELDRSVALKLPRKGQLSAVEAEQFLREARAAAQLRHPNIVAVHEVGRADDQVYIVSDYVRGATLAERLRSGRLTLTQGAALAASIADALQHAHEAGVIHRDLKPGNILIDEAGKPHVTDFGLARRERVDITMTAEGSPFGTPAYMSPEQARGEARSADRRTDIYSLGVILYELLTGELPFRGNLRMVLHQVLHEEPAPPRHLDPSVHRDLETICLKCMEKLPSRRYETAGEVGAELRRFLAGEPIQARPVGRTERLWRWARRKPALASLSGLALAGLLGVALASVLLAITKARSAQALATEQSRTTAALASSQRLAAELALDKGQLLGEQGDVNLALLWMVRALELVPEGAHELERAIRLNLGAWSREAVHLERVVEAPGAPELLAFSSDGNQLLIASADGVNLDVQVMDSRDGSVASRFSYQGEGLHYAAASGDLSRLLVAYVSGACRMFDVQTGEVLWELSKPGRVTLVSLSPDDHTALLAWNNSASARAGSTVQLYDVETGQAAGPPIEQELSTYAGAFSPDGERFAVATGIWGTDVPAGTISIWTLEGQAWCARVQPESMTMNISFSLDGTRLFSGHLDFGVREWELARAGADATPPVRLVCRQDGPVARVLADPRNPEQILTACYDGTARLWNVRNGEQIGPPLRHEMLAIELAVRPDGSAWATGSLARDVRLWKTSTMDSVVQPGVLLEMGDRPVDAQRDENHRVTLTDSVSGKVLGNIPHPGPVHLHQSAISTDGRLAATVGDDQRVRIWNLETERVVATTAEQAFATEFSPDGRRLLTGGWNAASVWDSSTGSKLLHLPLSSPAGPVFDVAYSPDGRLMAGGGADSAAHLWDSTTGAEVGRLAHATAAATVTFSPDGARLAVGGHEGMRIWSVGSGERDGTLLREDAFVSATAFDPAGQLLLSGGNAGRVRLWDVATGKPVGPVMDLAAPKDDGNERWPVTMVGFTPDGRTAYASPGGLGPSPQPLQPATRFWVVPEPVAGPAHEIRSWAERITGMSLAEDADVRVLGAAAWFERREPGGRTTH